MRGEGGLSRNLPMFPAQHTRIAQPINAPAKGRESRNETVAEPANVPRAAHANRSAYQRPQREWPRIRYAPANGRESRNETVAEHANVPRALQTRGILANSATGKSRRSTVAEHANVPSRALQTRGILANSATGKNLTSRFPRATPAATHPPRAYRPAPDPEAADPD